MALILAETSLTTFIAPINEANRNEQLNFIKEYKNKLANIDKAQLTGESLLSYEILARDLDLAIEDAIPKSLNAHKSNGRHCITLLPR